MKNVKLSSFFIIFLTFCCFTITAAPKAGKHISNEPIVIATDKVYEFLEQLYDLPIKPFVLSTINENELLSADPQVLRMYEVAINEEKQPDLFKNPNQAIKAWFEVEKITQNNPFLKIAQKRLSEWKTCMDLYERRQVSIDRLKILIASTALPSVQKVNIVSKHLTEFGVTFGTQKIMNLIQTAQDKEAVTENDVFRNKLKEIKQKRCNIGSGKDCYDVGKYFTAVEYERKVLFQKACDLKYQPGCEEQPAVKPEPKPTPAPAPVPVLVPAPAPVPVPQKAPEKTVKVYEFTEEPVDLVKPMPEINNADILNADQQVIKLLETAMEIEKKKETITKPETAVAAWENIAKAGGKNPFISVAEQRIADWNAAISKLNKHEDDLSKLNIGIANNMLQSNQKVALVVNYLNESGVTFGTQEVLDSIQKPKSDSSNSDDIYKNYAFYMSVANSKEIANNETIKIKIKEVRNKRCELKSGRDCKTYAENHAANEEEKAAYMKKACEFGLRETCENKAAAAQQSLLVAEQPAKEAKPEQKAKTEDDKYKEELNKAGRKKRLVIASTTLAAGVVIGTLGGISLYGMHRSKEDRDYYRNVYDDMDETYSPEDFEECRKLAKDADKRRKKYAVLGGIGIGVGAALITTGIVFFSIETKGEKKVKQKYNVSFGANPFDGKIQLTLNW